MSAKLPTRQASRERLSVDSSPLSSKSSESLNGHQPVKTHSLRGATPPQNKSLHSFSQTKQAPDYVNRASKNRPLTSFNKVPSSQPLSSRPKTAPGLGYSSHDAATKEGASTSPVLQSIANEHAKMMDVGSPGRGGDGNDERRLSILSTSSIGSAIARGKAADRRHDLLEEEHSTRMTLEIRRQEFMQNIASWVADNPAISTREIDHVMALRKAKKASKKSRSALTPAATKMTHHSDNEMTEEERKMFEDKAWKDLTKCRYLRIDDDMVDFSGVNTLAKDQMALFKSFKNQANAVGDDDDL